MFKDKNRNTRKRCEICPKLTIKHCHWRRSGVFIVNFENTSNLFTVFFIVDFEQVNVNPITHTGGSLFLLDNLNTSWKCLKERFEQEPQALRVYLESNPGKHSRWSFLRKMLTNSAKASSSIFDRVPNTPMTSINFCHGYHLVLKDKVFKTKSAFFHQYKWIKQHCSSRRAKILYSVFKTKNKT